MITLTNISKVINGRTLFDGVTMTFNAGYRYGLTGPNGSGKSTLLKIMMGLEKSTSGSITIPKKTGFLTQNIEDYRQTKVIDTVIMGNPRLWEALSKRDLLYSQEITDEVGIKLAEIEEIIQAEDGYSADSSAEKLLVGMGIDSTLHLKKMEEIPIDRQFRVLLCQALFGNPDALLLDEPTNHLDLEAIEWLISFLKNYQGTLIVISHDRHFLNTITTHIADIDYETIIIYPGNYDQMIVSKTSLKEGIEAENKSKEKKIKQLQEFVSKFSAGTRASQVQSRLKEIEKLQPAELKKSNIQRPYIRIPTGEKQAAKVPFKIENLSKSYDDNLVFKNFNLDIIREDKIACIGNNGEGKSTFLKILAGQLSQTSGTIEIGQNVNLGYFPQNHSDIIDKNSEITIFDWLKEKKIKAYDQDIRNVLGKMLFSGEDAFKKIGVLSGGETARLILAGLMLTAPNVIILDEPNNHLDLESVSALASGLEEYKGTIIFASHDRDLLAHVATKLLIFEKKKITLFEGPFEEYFSSKKY
jgi:ATPase subunit of ABC transporter with duplicated ATPase domains